MTAEWQRDIDRLDDAIRRHAGVPDTTRWLYHGPDEHSPIEHMWRVLGSDGLVYTTGEGLTRHDLHVPEQFVPVKFAAPFEFDQPAPETCSGCGLPADHQLNMFSGDGLKGPASQRLCAYCDMLRIEPDHSPQDPAPRATARGYVRGFRLLAGLTVFVLAFSGIIPEPWVLSAAFIAFGPPWSKRPEGT